MKDDIEKLIEMVREAYMGDLDFEEYQEIIKKYGFYIDEDGYVQWE